MMTSLIRKIRQAGCVVHRLSAKEELIGTGREVVTEGRKWRGGHRTESEEEEGAGRKGDEGK